MQLAESDPVLIYENSLYVVKRMHDPVAGETALIHLHMPQDGLKEFTIPLASMVVKERLREELARHGVAAGDAQTIVQVYDGDVVHTRLFETQGRLAHRGPTGQRASGWHLHH